MKKIAIRICSFMIFFFMICNINAFAKEDIITGKVIDFNLEMNVNADSTVDVIETFSINATENMKEYIVKRSFPLEYDGRKIEISDIKVLENNNAIQFNTIRKDRNIVLNLTEKDKGLSLGTHKYTVKYKVKNLINFEKNTEKIRWHLFSDSWGIPVNNFNVRVNFPNETQIKKDDFIINSLTNNIEVKKNDVSQKSSNNYVEFSYSTVIYPGNDIILEGSFHNSQFSKPTLANNISNFLKENVISIIILALSVILFIYEVYSLKQSKNVVEESEDVIFSNKLKFLIVLAGNLFIFIIAIMLGKTINYDITENYMKNVFIKFLLLLLIETFIVGITYFIIKYEFVGKNKFNKIISVFVTVPIICLGIMYVMNLFEDVFYNMFGYIVLTGVLVSTIRYIYKLKY